MKPMAKASFQFFRITAGSSSASARKVINTATVVERNFIQDWSVPSAAAPSSAPIMSLGNRPDHVFGHSRCNSQPDRQQCCQQGQAEPQRGERENFSHSCLQTGDCSVNVFIRSLQLQPPVSRTPHECFRSGTGRLVFPHLRRRPGNRPVP